MADLRDSGAIEQDADMVWLIHRPSYYNPRRQTQGRAEIDVAKNRSGPTGVVELIFDGNITRFESIGKPGDVPPLEDFGQPAF